MHRFFSSIFYFFLSPWGILLLGGLDSSMLFFLPAAIDTAVIIMAAEYRNWFWIFPLLAMLGSMAGATVTYYMGAKIGEAGLQKWIPERRLKRVRTRLHDSGAVAMGAAALLPPPFPLTPFVLTSGALGLDRKRFLLSLGSMRLVRFGLEAGLALLYGRQIVDWMKSPSFELMIEVLMVLAVAGTGITIYQMTRRVRY